MMTRILMSAAAFGLLGACEADTNPDKSQDRGVIGTSSLQDLTPGIWVDPDGCEHWLIDDGVEGYLSARLNDDGSCVRSGAAPPEFVTGPFRAGQDVNDPV